MTHPGSLIRRTGVLGVVARLVAFTVSCSVRTISTGHVGIATLFGAITGERLPEGIHFVNPLERIAELSVRTQESKEHAEVPSSEQDAQRMQFVLQKEMQEAERKRLEAQGVADFQRIVSQGLSQQLLEWKGIEATEKLVGSRTRRA